MSRKHDLTLTIDALLKFCASRYHQHAHGLPFEVHAPLVARFILAEGPAKMWGQIQAARAADPKTDQPSPSKVDLKRTLAQVPFL